MIGQRTVLEIKKGEKTYSFYCEPDALLGEVHDVLAEMKAKVVAMILERDKPAEEKKEEKAGCF